ncbi:MAG: hypothetical protein SF066_19855 [Thermoanaerobaculia bacterium]|nr:hypothetical protein [Thermoanaerobaculia bacterium]
MNSHRLTVLLALVLLASPALAGPIGPGADLWTTRGDGRTFVDFSTEPIPAGFFCPGSQPFTGRIDFRGVPIVGAPGTTDTIVERLDEANFNERGVAVTRTRVRAIQLEGLAAISTSCGAYAVRVSLAPGEQPLNRMRIKQVDDNGGTFTANLALVVRMTFTPVGRRAPVRTFDHTVVFERPASFPWARAASRLEQSREMMIDTNADGRVDTRIARNDFLAGWSAGAAVQGGAFEGAPQALRELLEEELRDYHEAPTHAHYVYCETCAEP